MSGIRSFLGSRLGLITCLVLAGAGAYLLWNHTGHVFSAAPYVLLLTCPLLHLFGHGYHHHGEAEPPRDSSERRTPPAVLRL